MLSIRISYKKHNMYNELISIIVPIYNASKYLCRCIDSLCKQTYENIEIILIDDGSTDNSYEICLNYALADKRIRAFTQKNQGQSAARNYGLDIAQGTHIFFMDADDYVDHNIIKYLYTACKKNNADIAMCDFYKVFNENKKIYEHGLEDGEVITKSTALRLLCKEETIENFLWNKLFARNVWNQVRFPVGKLYEDYSVMHLVFEHANQTVYIKQPLYYYVYYSNSSVHSQRIKKEIIDLFDAKKERYDYMKKYPKLQEIMYKCIVRTFIRYYSKCAKEKGFSENIKLLGKYEEQLLSNENSMKILDKSNKLYLTNKQKFILLCRIKGYTYRGIRGLYHKIRRR